MLAPRETYFQKNSKLLTWCILHNIHYYYDELWKYVSQILSRASVLESFCRGYRDFWFCVVLRLRPTYVSNDNVIQNYKEHNSDHRDQLYYLKWETRNETENKVMSQSWNEFESKLKQKIGWVKVEMNLALPDSR